MEVEHRKKSERLVLLVGGLAGDFHYRYVGK